MTDADAGTIPAFLDRTGSTTAAPGTEPVTSPPLPTPALKKPRFDYIDENDDACSLPQAHGIRIKAPGGSLTYGVGQASVRATMFAAFGMMQLALATGKRAQNPIAEIEARFSKVSDVAWGDEKPAKVKKPPKDPLAELVDVVRTVKQAKGLAFDESAFRTKCADAAFKRNARKVPEVAAEFARRATPLQSATPASDPVAAL